MLRLINNKINNLFNQIINFIYNIVLHKSILRHKWILKINFLGKKFFMLNF